jgi:hypothetical protein
MTTFAFQLTKEQLIITAQRIDNTEDSKARLALVDGT